jgi:hypothetical protein
LRKFSQIECGKMGMRMGEKKNAVPVARRATGAALFSFSCSRSFALLGVHSHFQFPHSICGSILFVFSVFPRCSPCPLWFDLFGGHQNALLYPIGRNLHSAGVSSGRSGSRRSFLKIPRKIENLSS